MSRELPLIAHAIHHLVIGGLENGLVNLIDRIPHDEFRHAIICIDDYDEAFARRISRRDVEIIPLHRRSGNGIKLYPRITKLFKRLRPAILHSRSPSALDTLVPARLAGVPVRIHGEHGWDESDPGGTNRKNQWLRRLHRPFVSQYIALSTDIRRYLEDKIKVPPSRIRQIYNGVDTDRFRPGDMRASLELPTGFASSDRVLLGTVGRIQPVKAQHDIVHAVAHLFAQQPDLRDVVRVLIVGGGPLHEQLRQQVAEAGLADIFWLPGARHDVPRLLQAMDVFVLPSLAEGISNTILEAMATGLPVVASHVGGNKELIVAGVTGTLVEPAAPLQLADALREYIVDPARRRAAGRAARARVLEQFSLETMVAQYLDVYRRAVAK